MRQNVSPEMRRHPFVSALQNNLGDRLVFTTGRVPNGYFKADTVKEQGFSLHVNSQFKSKTVSLLHMTRGLDRVWFAPRQRLEMDLPDRPVEVAAFADLLHPRFAALGVDYDEKGPKTKPSLPVDNVLLVVDRLSALLLPLA